MAKEKMKLTHLSVKGFVPAENKECVVCNNLMVNTESMYSIHQKLRALARIFKEQYKIEPVVFSWEVISLVDGGRNA